MRKIINSLLYGTGKTKKYLWTIILLAMGALGCGIGAVASASVVTGGIALFFGGLGVIVFQSVSFRDVIKEGEDIREAQKAERNRVIDSEYVEKINTSSKDEADVKAKIRKMKSGEELVASAKMEDFFNHDRPENDKPEEGRDRRRRFQFPFRISEFKFSGFKLSELTFFKAMPAVFMKKQKENDINGEERTKEQKNKKVKVAKVKKEKAKKVQTKSKTQKKEREAKLEKPEKTKIKKSEKKQIEKFQTEKPQIEPQTELQIQKPQIEKPQIEKPEEKRKSVNEYTDKEIKKLMHAFKVKRDHKKVIIDLSIKFRIRQCPAFMWRERKELIFLLLEEEPRTISIPLEKIKSIQYDKMVEAKPRTDYESFREPGLVTKLFSPYLPQYHEFEHNGRMEIYKNLYTIVPDIQLTNHSVRDAFDMLQVDIEVNDSITNSPMYDDYFKMAYRTHILWLDQVITTNEYKDKIKVLLTSLAGEDISKEIFHEVLNQLIHHKLITWEYGEYYRDLRR